MERGVSYIHKPLLCHCVHGVAHGSKLQIIGSEHSCFDRPSRKSMLHSKSMLVGPDSIQRLPGYEYDPKCVYSSRMLVESGV